MDSDLRTVDDNGTLKSVQDTILTNPQDGKRYRVIYTNGVPSEPALILEPTEHPAQWRNNIPADYIYDGYDSVNKTELYRPSTATDRIISEGLTRPSSDSTPTEVASPFPLLSNRAWSPSDITAMMGSLRDSSFSLPEATGGAAVGDTTVSPATDGASAPATPRITEVPLAPIVYQGEAQPREGQSNLIDRSALFRTLTNIPALFLGLSFSELLEGVVTCGLRGCRLRNRAGYWHRR